MPNNKQLGDEGEKLAQEFLIKQGYKILQKNWRFKHLEIDIIASINELLVVVEVKLREDDYFGKPEEFVTKSKQKNLIKAADIYIKENNIFYETRFDIISIMKSGNKYELNHITEAFYPTL